VSAGRLCLAISSREYPLGEVAELPLCWRTLADSPVTTLVAWNATSEPEGLDGLLQVATALRQTSRLGLLLGQAGNRKDADILRLADVAASHRPELVVLKGVDGYERGRPAAEVPRMLHAALVRHGYTDSQLPIHIRELDAVRKALQWAQPSDVLVLAVHTLSARGKLARLIAVLQEDAWQAGQALPARCFERG